MVMLFTRNTRFHVPIIADLFEDECGKSEEYSLSPCLHWPMAGRSGSFLVAHVALGVFGKMTNWRGHLVDRESLTNNDCTPASMWGLGQHPGGRQACRGSFVDEE